MSVLDEIEAHKRLVAHHVAALGTHQQIVTAHPELHVLPVLEQQQDGTTQVTIHIVNIKGGAAHTLKMEGVAAACFYAAYREAISAIFDAAAVHAHASLEQRRQELRGALEQEKLRLQEAEAILSGKVTP